MNNEAPQYYVGQIVALDTQTKTGEVRGNSSRNVQFKFRYEDKTALLRAFQQETLFIFRINAAGYICDTSEIKCSRLSSEEEEENDH